MPWAETDIWPNDQPKPFDRKKGVRRVLGKLSGEMNHKGDRAEGRVRFGKDKAGASGIPFRNNGWGQNARFLQKLTHGTQ